MKKFALLLYLLPLLALTGGCAPREPGANPAQTAITQTVSALHTQAAGTLQAAAALTPSPSTAPTSTPPAAMPPAPTVPAALTPTETGMPAAIPTVVTVPTMVDVPLLDGYRSYGSRVLAQPAAVVRDGITVAVEQVAVYQERIELVYTVRDIPHALLFDPMNDDPSLSCGGPDAYPNLLLPDGTVIYPENYLLDGKARGMFEPFAASYLIHLYRKEIPADVTELTLYLNCLELMRLDQSPKHWYVPFRIVPVN